MQKNRTRRKNVSNNCAGQPERPSLARHRDDLLIVAVLTTESTLKTRLALQQQAVLFAAVGTTSNNTFVTSHLSAKNRSACRIQGLNPVALGCLLLGQSPKSNQPLLPSSMPRRTRVWVSHSRARNPTPVNNSANILTKTLSRTLPSKPNGRQ